MAIPKEVLDDLSSRFIMSLPDEEREDPVRACFHAEKAHWFYIDHLDYYAAEIARSSICPKCNVREFIKQIFQHCTSLQRHSKDIDLILEKWRDYKGVIPTHGAILLDESLENVLLVQGFHSKASWGFPKGKCNEEELPHHCAIREVKEETGFDITQLIDENEYLERFFSDKPTRLYVVAGVPHDYEFKPTTRNEIKECRWFYLDTLPTSRTDMSKPGNCPNNFYMVFPYVEQIKKWVMHHRRGGRQSSASARFQGGASVTPTTMNGENRMDQHTYYSQHVNRSSPRVRSISHSSPTAFYASSDHGSRQSFSSSMDKHRNSSGKQQQKKNKKTSTCRQKLDFESANESELPNIVSLKPVATISTSTPISTGQRKLEKAMETKATPTAAEAVIRDLIMKNAVSKLEVQPSQTWQKFHFNWEPLLSTI